MTISRIELDLSVGRIKAAINYYDYQELINNRLFYTRMVHLYGDKIISFWYNFRNRFKPKRVIKFNRSHYISTDNQISEQELLYAKTINFCKQYSTLECVYLDDVASLLEIRLPMRDNFYFNVYSNESNIFVYLNEFPITQETKTRKSILFANVALNRSYLNKIMQSNEDSFKFVVNV